MRFTLKWGRYPEDAGATGFMLTRSCLKLLSAVLLSFVPVLGTAGVARSVVCGLQRWDGTETQLSESEIIQTIQETVNNPKIERNKKYYSDYDDNCSIPNKLARLGPPAVPHLIPLLQSQDATTRQIATYALGLIGKSAASAVPALITLFKQENSLPRPMIQTLAQRTAVAPAADYALGMIGEPALPDLVELILLSEKNETLQNAAFSTLGYAAFSTLGYIGESAIPVLMPLLKHKNRSVRHGVMLSLSRMGEPAIPLLLTLLRDDDEWMRLNAVDLLAEMRTSMNTPRNWREARQLAIPAVTALLKDKSARVRSRVVIALARMEKSVIPLLIPLLNDEDPIVRSTTLITLRIATVFNSQIIKEKLC
jgi:HEAT repeat protein